MMFLKAVIWLIPLAVAWMPMSVAAEADKWAESRAELMDAVSAMMRSHSRTTLDPGVAAAMNAAPRHEFVTGLARGVAYINRPLDIGYGQTISQPFIVALMTQMLEPQSSEKALEIGTGSGWQAAVLSAMVDEIYTIEIIKELGESAAERLARLEYDNVTARIGDGYYGWKEHAPFDLIIVTAAASHIPPSLIEQLKPGGRMIIPISTGFYVEYLMYVEKQLDGSVHTEQGLPVTFVPLTGDH